MSVSRLLLDEMLSHKIAERLRSEGIDAEAVVERRELAGASDEATLELATSEARVLVTKNLVDFVPLAQQWAVTGRTHGGLVLVSTKTFPENRFSAQSIASALIRVCADGEIPAPGQSVWLQLYDSADERGPR